MKLSLTSTSISSDDMSTIVPMPVRVKPPPADTGEIISPGCASFEIATPLNGARTTMSSRSVLRRWTWLSATAPAPAYRRSGPSANRRPPAPCRPRRCRRRPPSAGAAAVRDSVRPRGAGPGPPQRSSAPRRQLRLRERERGAHLRVVQPREHLPFADGLALFDEDLDHLAGHLRRDRRSASRRDVTRGIEDRSRTRRAARRRRPPSRP